MPLRIVALLLTVLTGFSGLVYEVAWEKYLATLLGAHSEATAAVLGLFLGGLSLGYSLFGSVTRRLVERTEPADRAARLLIVYGCLEAGIGIYALLFPYLFKIVRFASTFVPFGSGGLGFAFDVTLSALLILPSAVLMGGTIPMLTQALARSLDDATRFHALVYAFNTAGAFAGALAAGFWLVPTLGLVGVLVAVSAINLLAGALFVAIGWRRPASLQLEAAPASADEVSAPGQVAGFSSFAAVALLTGFAMMAIQTSVIRLGGLSLGASQFTFSMVVAVFVLCIALGSFAVSAFSRIPRSALVVNLWALFAALFWLYLQLDAAPYWAHALRSLFRDQDAGFYPYFLSAFLGLALAIGVPVVLSGASLPLIFHVLRREFGALGDVAGRLYSWNTVGSLLGALLGGYALLFWLDLHHVYRLALAAVAASATLVSVRMYGVGRASAAVLLVAPLIAVSLLPAWSPTRLSAGLFRTRSAGDHTFAGPEKFFAKRRTPTLRFYDDDPTASVAVLEYPRSDGRIDRSIVTNGKSDGSSLHDYVTMAMAGLVPAVLAERAERAFVIGLGTGVTAGELASLGSMREVVVAEISPGVIDAAPLFDHANLGLSRRSSVRTLRSDAYRALLRSEGSFDVIASEPSNPWVTGVEMLFSREFLEAARNRLTPGGVYAQWFHVYETDPETVAMVLRTYASVFDHVAVWYAQGADLLLLGVRSPRTALDLPRIEARFGRPDFRAAFERCEISSVAELLVHELLPLGVVHQTPLPGRIHTLLHPRLSHLAARAFFSGGSGRLPPTAAMHPARVGSENSLLLRHVKSRGGMLAESERSAMIDEACQFRPDVCLALLGQWSAQVPRSEERRRLRDALRANPVLSRGLAFDQIPTFARLYAGAAGRPPAADDGYATAQRATDLFRQYYFHGAPFSRRELAALWDGCLADPARREQCAAGRAEAEYQLGSLDSISIGGF